MQKQEEIKVALVDDHKLFRKGMIELINDFANCKVIYEATNGEEFTQNFSLESCPDIVLLDINMPIMGGYQTADWLRKNYPEVKVLALSMNDTEESIIEMLKSGAHGYILKDAEPAEVLLAITEIKKKGFYYSELANKALLNNMNKEHAPDKDNKELAKLNEREIEFLKLVCTQLTYKEIADQMFLAVRTVDGYREALFEKLQVKSRIGLVLYAIKHKIIKVS